MCDRRTRRVIGIGCTAFGAGILFSYLAPGIFLAIAEAVALGVAGIVLLKK